MEISASASAIFGSPSTDTIFTAGQSSGPGSVQEIARTTIEAQKREINRIRGYKLQLTVAEKQQLADIQVKIQEVDARAAAGTVRSDELEDRKELFAEADRIIGKPTVDADADEELADLASAIETLLQPKLSKPVARRVETLERLKDGLQAKIEANPDNRTVQGQFQSISTVINNLTPRRQTSELSIAEQRAYDDLVELVNAHAGAKVELTAKEATKVAALERSIASLQSALPEDISGQPTPAAVARAYVRLTL